MKQVRLTAVFLILLLVACAPAQDKQNKNETVSKATSQEILPSDNKEISELRDELAKLSAQVSELTESFTQAKLTIEKQQGEIETLKTQISNAGSSDLDLLREETRSIRSLVSSIEYKIRNVKDYDNDIRKLQDAISRLDGTARSYSTSDKLYDMGNRVEKLERTVSNLESKLR